MSKKCPVCNSSLQMPLPVEINQLVVCSNCGVELEVVWLYPLELAKVSTPQTDQKKQKRQSEKLKKVL